MDTLNTTFEKVQTRVSVTLQQSAFTEDGERFGRVTRNTATLENIIASILEKNRGMDPYIIQHSAYLLKQEILNFIENGYSVNMLDLGTLYLTMSGTVRGENPSSSDISGFKVKFTPSEQLNEAVSKIDAGNIVLVDKSPSISKITDEWTGFEYSVLTKSKTCLINGDNLKVGGDVYSISFVMVDDDGKEVENQEIVSVTDDKIICNTRTSLRFFIPEQLVTDAKYKIRITTSYLKRTVSRKKPLVTESKALVVRG